MESDQKFNNQEHNKHVPESPVETTQVGGKIYENDKLLHFAESLPVRELPIDDVRDAVREGYICWIDRNGEQLAPFQIIRDWSAAQQNEAWRDHVDSIKRAELDNPIWITKDCQVFDGVHRLTRAVIENRSTIKVRVFEELPKSALKSE